MLRVLLIRGMVVGVIAGLLGFGVAKIFGEPQVDRAIAFETQMEDTKKDQPVSSDAPAAATTNQNAASTSGSSGTGETGNGNAGAMANMPGMAHGHDNGDVELVSRGMQSTFGLLTAVLVYGAAFGGIFGLVYAYAWGRISGIGPRGLAALIALAAFVVIIVVPGLKYPANPPAVGEPETIGLRTELYLAMIIVSLGALVAAIQLFRGLVAQRGMWTAALSGVALYGVIVIIAMLLLPAVQEVPENFPAVVLWNFRVANWGIQAVLWATMGLLFGYLTERSLRIGGPVRRAR